MSLPLRTTRFRLLPAAALCLTLSACKPPEKTALPANAMPLAHRLSLVKIPGGTFTMGSSAPYAFANEGPAHQVTLKPFFIATHAVTNAEFARFVSATGYLTVAERPVDWEELKKQVPPGTPRPADDQLLPGSLVVKAPGGPVDLRDVGSWWQWIPGANWRQPEGPGSSVEGREKHPVVQIAFEDAAAYARWAGARLPTEAEWEFAARGGREQARYAWGDTDPHPAGGAHLANTWTGDFPHNNNAADGFAGTSPVGAFPANDYGLYDMGGNIWNWCSDIYAADTFAARAKQPEFCSDPAGPALGAGFTQMTGDPSPAEVPGQIRHVIKGGSFLCNPAYCESYRPAARRGSPPDTASAHVGFRIAMDFH